MGATGVSARRRQEVHGEPRAPTSFAHDFGMGDTHSTFSDPEMFAPSSFRGFTHHSNYAGDLIFGARTHQPQQSADYGPGFGFGSAGLGLSGMQTPPSGNLHPTLRTPGLPGIDEIELTSITLDDQVDAAVPMEETVDTAVPKVSTSPEPTLNLSELTSFSLPVFPSFSLPIFSRRALTSTTSLMSSPGSTCP